MKTQTEKKEKTSAEMSYEEITIYLSSSQPEWYKLSHQISQGWIKQELKELDLYSLLTLAIGQIGEERCKEWNDKILPLYIKQK
jgi:hypothetical protein